MYYMIKKIILKEKVEKLAPINSLEDISIGDVVEIVSDSNIPITKGTRYIVDYVSATGLHASRGGLGIGMPMQSAKRELSKVEISYRYYDKKF